MITFLCDFCQFLAKMASYLKANFINIWCSKITVIWIKNIFATLCGIFLEFITLTPAAKKNKVSRFQEIFADYRIHSSE
jgi:predicted membrane protein